MAAKYNDEDSILKLAYYYLRILNDSKRSVNYTPLFKS